MTPAQIEIVQSTFTPVAALGDAAAALFYETLFRHDPSLRPMFPAAGLESQGRKLMAMLTVAVRGLPQAHALVPALRDLGRRHTGYGVQPGHYDTVGAALLDTLEMALGPDFDAATREAWTAAYVLIATTMQAGAAEREVA